MDLVRGPLKAGAAALFAVGLLLLFLNPPSLSGAEGMAVFIGGGILLVLLRSETSDFDLLVADAIDDLPVEFQRLLHDTPVVVSQHGMENRAYGHYFGDTVARDNYPDRIVLYQDTLERDFGHDPELLRAQVERTLRHEVAHHLGWNEPGVRDLGL